MSFKYIRRKFLERMDSELIANERKGNWNTWTPSSEDGLSEISHHLAKLESAIEAGDKKLISEYSADIANISMKVSEIHGES